MRPDSSIEAYRKIIEPIKTYPYGGDGKQPGDPRKAADAMIQAIESPEPSLRLILGSDAFGAWDGKLPFVQKDIEGWRRVGEATAFEDTIV